MRRQSRRVSEFDVSCVGSIGNSSINARQRKTIRPRAAERIPRCGIAIPGIAGIEDVTILTSTAALGLAEPPRSLVVVGGGYIGCELAQMFARVGTAVTLVSRSRLLPEAKPEVSEALTDYLHEEGVTVRAGL